jgi:hypothetical protein
VELDGATRRVLNFSIGEREQGYRFSLDFGDK